MKRIHCDNEACGVILREKGAMLMVHHPEGLSGTFCSDRCYQAKLSAVKAPAVVITTERLHGDLETILAREF